MSHFVSFDKYSQLTSGVPSFIQLVDLGGILLLDLLYKELDTRVRLSFDSYFLYRKMEEGDALISLDELKNSGYSQGGIYLVQDSDLSLWLSIQSQGCVPHGKLQHYSIFCLNDLIDVLTLTEPKMELSSLKTHSVPAFGA